VKEVSAVKTENQSDLSYGQRDSVEREEYDRASSTDRQEAEEKDGADLLEKILDRRNLNRAYKQVKSNKGAPGIDGIQPLFRLSLNMLILLCYIWMVHYTRGEIPLGYSTER
jgi:hypothetical protein